MDIINPADSKYAVMLFNGTPDRPLSRFIIEQHMDEANRQRLQKELNDPLVKAGQTVARAVVELETLPAIESHLGQKLVEIYVSGLPEEVKRKRTGELSLTILALRQLIDPDER